MIRAFQLALTLAKTVFKSSWPWLVFLGLTGLLLEEWVLKSAQVASGSREPSMALIIVSVAVTFLWSIVSNAILVIVVARDGWQVLAKEPLPSALNLMNQHLKPLTIETLRAMSWIFVWLLALILPGVIKYLQYTFVAYIVLLDKNYHRGDVDALQRSSELAKGHLWFLLVFNGLFFVMTLALQGIGQSFSWTLFSAPIPALMLQGVTQAISLMWALVLFCFYWQKMENAK